MVTHKTMPPHSIANMEMLSHTILKSSLNRQDLWGFSLSTNKGNPTHMHTATYEHITHNDALCVCYICTVLSYTQAFLYQHTHSVPSQLAVGAVFYETYIARGGGYSHVKTYGMCPPNELLCHQKSLDMGPIWSKKS